VTALSRSVNGFFFMPVALGRVAAMRFLAGLYIWLEWWAYKPFVIQHRFLSEELYQPLFIGRLLPIPAPNYWIVVGTFAVMLASALPMMFGYRPKLFGWILFIAYFEWMLVYNSYGKVDHANFGFMVLLLALCMMPSKAAWGDTETLSERAGWGFNMVQIAVVCTYFLSTWSKFRYGGFDWANSGVFAWAIIRRGTVLSDWMLDFPGLLTAAQWGMIAFELLTPVVLFVYRWKKIQYSIIAFFYAFHIAVFAALTISFLPHLFAMACFLPWERVQPRDLMRKLPRPPGLVRRKLQAGKAVPSRSKPDEPVREAERAS
jgi:hypothetical protein